MIGELNHPEVGVNPSGLAFSQPPVARAEKEKPDLVVTDFMMSIADGWTLVRKRASSPAPGYGS